MRRFWALLGFSTAALALGMWLTLATGLGTPLSHYNVVFAVLVGGAAATWPFLKRRRVASMTMAYMGVVATLTAIPMLYTKQFPYKEWVTWWHSATSFAFLLAFLAHWFLNRVRLWGFTKDLSTRVRTAAPLGLAWLAIAAATWWTWSPAGRVLFRSENYLYLASWAIFVGVAFTYGLWLLFRHPSVRGRLTQAPARKAAVGAIDTSLFVACWGALITGFALLYFREPLIDGGFKYVSKWWHTATSVALLALVAIHIGFNARIVRAHTRRLDGDLAPKTPPRTERK